MDEDLLKLVSPVGNVDISAERLTGLLLDAKRILHNEETGRLILETLSASPWAWPPRMDPYLPEVGDDYNGGRRWHRQIEVLAASLGNPWVPAENHNLLGVDLSGIWQASLDDTDRTYIRQFGPYVNVVMGLTDEPRVLAEGLYDPNSSRVAFVGRNLLGATCVGSTQLQSHWLLDGEVKTTGFFGDPQGELLVLLKIG